jgi:hypothetical protein
MARQGSNLARLAGLHVGPLHPSLQQVTDGACEGSASSCDLTPGIAGSLAVTARLVMVVEFRHPAGRGGRRRIPFSYHPQRLALRASTDQLNGSGGPTIRAPSFAMRSLG